MALLGVNIDHVATLRQARRGMQPDPVLAAQTCLGAGADSIVAHLREDRRHIQDGDVVLLKKTLHAKFNLEMSIDREIVGIACKVKPDQSTLVPEHRQELTTEGGLDVTGNRSNVAAAVGRLHDAGIEVSLFIDPDVKQIIAAKKTGVTMVELHTGRYADAKTPFVRKRALRQLREAVKAGVDNGIHVFAGHGLDYDTILDVARIKEIEEFNIGYAIICRSIMVGLDRAVREMKALIV
ncbi:MAG TPA: pyridoxine 5'-phosphate synthase [Candidatus Omnitrophota bacterium]|nr:pyridoxine 5'-phosphate synthase [Candidatus Omnitrophota bacterium]